MLRFTLFFSVLMLTANIVSAAKPRNESSVRTERRTTEKKIQETAVKIERNRKGIEQKKESLSKIQSNIKSNEQLIERTTAELRSADSRIAAISDTIARLDKELYSLNNAYIKAMRGMQASQILKSPMLYLLSSKSVSEATARLRYIRRFGKWRTARVAHITAIKNRSNKAHAELASLQSQRAGSLRELASMHVSLKNEYSTEKSEEEKLKKDNRKLESDLSRAKQRLAKLDADLERIIAKQNEIKRKEQEKQNKKQSVQKTKSSNKKGASSQSTSKTVEHKADPDRYLTGSFESNKGKLLFPVTGTYTIVRGYGNQPLPGSPNVMAYNSGIDIGVKPGTKARAIYEGTVSAIFKQDGFGNIVMVRHGNYLSIYANLSSLNVKSGDTLKAGQSIGTVGADAYGGRGAVLHFEVRKERNKLNPLQWVK